MHPFYSLLLSDSLCHALAASAPFLLSLSLAPFLTRSAFRLSPRCDWWSRARSGSSDSSSSTPRLRSSPSSSSPEFCATSDRWRCSQSALSPSSEPLRRAVSCRARQPRHADAPRSASMVDIEGAGSAAIACSCSMPRQQHLW